VPVYTWDGEKWTTVSGPAGSGASPENTLPLMNGTANAGVAYTYSRGDHIHPTDTTRVPEAPTDGKIYGRMSGAWTQVSTTAGGTSFTPVGQVAATNVQAAIAEVDSEKVAKAGDIMTGSLTIAGGDLRSYRAGGATGVLYLSSSGSYYLYWDGTRYSLPAAPLGIGTPATGTDAARVDWVDSGYLPRSGGTITGALTVNGELVAAAGYLRFTTSGGPGYIQFNGGGSYALGGGGTIYHTGNLNPNGGAVTSFRLAYLADPTANTNDGGLNEPYGGGVITGWRWQSGGLGIVTFRYRQAQILVNGGWAGVAYA
jgi:hypothetical protein